MLLRPFLNDVGSCASYLFGCTSHRKLAVVDPHVDLVDDYIAAAAGIGAPIVAVLETHVQADHVRGCRRWSSGRVRPATCRPVQPWRSRMLRWTTATPSSSGTRS